MSDQRKLLTWTLNAGNKAYEDDLEKYGHKIYALGVHEVQVEKTGECYIRRDIPSDYNGTDYGTYRYGKDVNPADGIPDLKIDKTTDFDRTRSFWVSIEKGMRRWKHIRHYLSFILFGGSRVVPMLDNVNSAQDKLIERIGATLDYLGTSVNFPNDPDNMKYIKGIEIDFEASMSGSTYANRSGDNIKFMNILKRIKNEVCIPRGIILQVNAYAMWGKDNPYYYRFHDYGLFATTTDMNGNSVIDELQIMTYDFAWNGSAPGASTPLWWFEKVATWAKDNFGAANSKLKMNNVFFGSAGYGHRWGVYDKDRMYGSTITYRNFIDWQNGLYKHNHKRDDGIYEWHNQEFLAFCGFEDQESKNEILQQHIYDYFKARYGSPTIVNGAASVRLSEYNGGEYLTTYSRLQKARFTGLQARTFVPSSTNIATTKNKVYTYSGINSIPITIDEVGKDPFTITGITGRQVYKGDYIPKTIEGSGLVCSYDESGKVTYTLDMPNAGDYELVALVSFPWYNQRKLGGNFNGSPLTIEAAADYYPIMFKASHWYSCGVKSFNAGANTITIDGDLGDGGTVIYGFVACEKFDPRYGGGEVSFNTSVKPFKKKDGTLAAIPETLALTAKALRQSAIPLIMWDDRFSQYLDDPATKDDLTNALYYKRNTTLNVQGNGTTLSSDSKYCYDPSQPKTYESGYSWGVWQVRNDDYNGSPDSVHVKFGNSDDSRGRLLVNYEFKANMQISTEFRVTDDGLAGVQLLGTNGRDGYVFGINYATRSVVLTLNDELLYSEPLPANFYMGDRTKVRAIVHNNKAYFYYGYSDNPAFGGAIDIVRTGGGVAGLYANVVGARFYALTISTTDKWDLMEKFTVSAVVNGQTYSKTFGEIARQSQYTTDPTFGYLNYSGLDEKSIRISPEESGSGGEDQFYSEDISLDYEFFITEIPGIDGTIPVTVTFNDPGIWFGHLYVVDKQGGSVTWVGDSYSFLDSMNRAVNDFGAKGIGLWAMGQEDPKVFDNIPEVVPYHD
jgi:spore germination protein YaaH